MAENDVAHAARDCKADLNVVVQRYIVNRVAERALKARMDLVKLAKAASDLRAIGADEQPVHLEQANLGSVHEQLYRVRLGQVDEGAISDRVEAKELIVVGGTDKPFELREDIRCPASCRSECAEALAQDTLVDRRRDTHLLHSTRQAHYAIGPPAELHGGRHHRLVRLEIELDLAPQQAAVGVDLVILVVR